jgi:hypothetical protein
MIFMAFKLYRGAFPIEPPIYKNIIFEWIGKVCLFLVTILAIFLG